MKFVIAPDSFKNCLRASEVCFRLAAGIRSSAPAAELLPLPLADGGEGTTEAVAEAAAGELHTAAVTGPFGEPVKAPFAVLPDGAAVFEMAAASGLEVADGRLDPLRATTFGTGELFRYLLDLGVRDFVIGIGGSATVDGGAGIPSTVPADAFRPVRAAGGCRRWRDWISPGWIRASRRAESVSLPK